VSGLSLRERLDWRRFVRGEPPRPGPVPLTHRRIFILPSRRALGLGVLLALQWLAAMNYNNNLAYLLIFLLAATALVSVLHTYRNLAHLTVRAGPGTPAFAGGAAVFEYAVENPSGLPRRAVRLRLDSAAPTELNPDPGQTVQARLELPAPRRGWMQPGPLTVETRYPLGLFRAWSPLRFDQRTLVYPRPADDRRPFPGQGGDTAGAKEALGDFHGFREYRAGDSLKRVHWRGVAKAQGVNLKQFSGGSEGDLLLDWDATPEPGVEARLSRLCRWVLDAESAGLRYGLVLPGTALPPGRGAEHARRCLETLALFRS